MSFQFHEPQLESPLAGPFIPGIPEDVAERRYRNPMLNPHNVDYDHNTGHIAQANMAIFRDTPTGRVWFTEHGAQIYGWDIADIPIIATGTFERHHVERDTARGNVPHLLPQASHDMSSNAAYPFHGYLPRTRTHFEVELSTLDTVVFSVSYPEILASMNPHPGVLHYVIYQIEQDGSITSCIQTFNFGHEQLDIAPGIHPYLNTHRTPLENIQTTPSVAQERMNLNSLQDTESIAMKGADGMLQRLVVSTHEIVYTLTPLAGYSVRDAQFWLWTDNRAYLCGEGTCAGAQYMNRDARHSPDAQDAIAISPQGFALFANNVHIALREG